MIFSFILFASSAWWYVYCSFLFNGTNVIYMFVAIEPLFFLFSVCAILKCGKVQQCLNGVIVTPFIFFLLSLLLTRKQSFLMLDVRNSLNHKLPLLELSWILRQVKTNYCSLEDFSMRQEKGFAICKQWANWEMFLKKTFLFFMSSACLWSS